MTPARFTAEELSYLRDQPLGRLATVDEQHAPQVVPVGFFVDEQTGDVSIGDIALGSTRKFPTSRRPAARRSSSTTSPRPTHGTSAGSRSGVTQRPSGTSTHRGPG